MKNILKLQQFNRPDQDEAPGTFVLVCGDKRAPIGTKVKCLVMTKTIKKTPEKILRTSPARVPATYIELKLAIPGVGKLVRFNAMSHNAMQAWVGTKGGSLVELSSRPMKAGRYEWMALAVEKLVVAREL